MTGPEPVADLSTCDSEPIHIPSHIQSHGFLVVCNSETWRITHASANLSDLTAGHPLGRPLEDVIGSNALHALNNALAVSTSPGLPGRVLGLHLFGSHFLNAAIHNYGGRTLVEIESAATAYGDVTPLFLVRSMLTRMQQAGSVEEVCAIAVNQLQVLIGFDRVMIYKFLHDGSGNVIAESRSDKVPSFLNHHFPASDIPRQARDLYLKSWMRMIANVNSPPVPIIAAETSPHAPVDLSYCALRSVSPIHIEYLKNMGVGASMSISIIVGGSLWGLIACHNTAAKIIPTDIRVAAEFFGQAFSLQLQSLERVDIAKMLRSARSGIDNILAEIPPDAPLMESLGPRLADLAAFVPCDGAGLWCNGEWIDWGTCPPKGEISDLVATLNRISQGAVFATHELRSVHPAGLQYAELASGLLAVPLSRTPGDYLIFFRKEYIHTIDWAGNPSKPVERADHGDRLTPRKSFELWRNEVKGTSRVWETQDRFIAEALRISLLEIVLRYKELVAIERARAERQQQLFVAELNHRVKNALALIGALITHSKDKHHNLPEFVSDLEGRIRSLALAHDLASRSGALDLRRLLQAELEPFVGESRQIVELSGPEVALDEHAYAVLALILHEMTTNAAKYGALSTGKGKLRVDWQFDPNGDCRINWIERGGPNVVAPNVTGFGHMLVRRQIPFELGGRSELFFEPGGLRAMFLIPAKLVRTIATPERSSLPRSLPAEAIIDTPVNVFSVLIVEDSLIVSLAIERMLRPIGAESFLVCGSIDEALEHVRASPIDIAVLDINLKQVLSYPVADALLQKGIPFVFATGYGSVPELPERFMGKQIVTKPFTESGLVAAVRAALHQSASPDEP